MAAEGHTGGRQRRPTPTGKQSTLIGSDSVGDRHNAMRAYNASHMTWALATMPTTGYAQQALEQQAGQRRVAG